MIGAAQGRWGDSRRRRALRKKRRFDILFKNTCTAQSLLCALPNPRKKKTPRMIRRKKIKIKIKIRTRMAKTLNKLSSVSA